MSIPLLVALTYADDLRFNGVAASLVPTGKIRDKDKIVLKIAVTLKSFLAEHSSTLVLFE